MSEENTKRLQIAGALASVLALIWALFFRQKAIAGAPGAPGSPGAAGVGRDGLPGIAGVAGVPGVAAAPATVTGPSSALLPGSPAEGGDPSTAAMTTAGSVIDLFLQIFDTGGSGPSVPQYQTSALAPRSDLQKYSAIESPKPAGAGRGCGCGGGCGGCGGNGGPCYNKPAPAIYPDGSGACLSSTIGTLSANQSNCGGPGNIEQQMSNMRSNLRYDSITTGIYDQAATVPRMPGLDDFLAIPVLRFGAA